MGRFFQGLPLKVKRVFLTIDKHADDGGPGSGNWGHKGRPGLVGGSGKGGGKQYRGGRGDVMYTSSKHDWLNGLSGEKQHEAQKWLKKHAEGLEPGKTAEQHIMESANGEDKDKLLGMMQEARHWNKLAGRLMSENLDDKDRKLVAALADKYGAAYKGGSLMPDENAEWSDEDKSCWQDLKSKAMRGPTSGQEAPDELQYEAGLKERPAKPEIPFGEEETNYWFDSLPSKDRNDLMYHLKNAGISAYGFGGTELLDAENRMYREASQEGASYKASAAVGYLQEKDRILGGSFKDELQAIIDGTSKTRRIGRLNEQGSVALALVMRAQLEAYRDTHGNEKTTLKDSGNYLEYLLCRNDDRFARMAYLRLKAAALGNELDPVALNSYAKTLAETAAKLTVKTEAERKKRHELENWKTVATPEFIESRYHPAAVAGVSRRPQGNMTFDEADNHRSNPDYRVSSNYRNNCQTCVVAHELRMRGYDVEALPRRGSGEATQAQLAKSHGGGLAWINPENGQPVEPITAVDAGQRTKAGVYKWFDTTVKPGQRYNLAFCWKAASGAHVVTLSRDDSGNLMIYDPQTDKLRRGRDAIMSYLGGCSITAAASGRWPMRLVRVDNALPNLEVVDKILKKAR